MPFVRRKCQRKFGVIDYSLDGKLKCAEATADAGVRWEVEGVGDNSTDLQKIMKANSVLIASHA